MNTTIRSRPFALGFISGLVLFLVINTHNFGDSSAEECFDCIASFGFPYRFYESGSIAHFEKILWSGLIADVVVA